MQSNGFNGRLTGTNRKTKIQWIISSLVGFLLLLYLVLTVSAPIREFRKISDPVFSDSLYLEQLSFQNPGFDSLLKEKAFIETQLIMAATDSIGLLISLRDSVASLTVKGVTIHSASIVRYRMDAILQKIDVPVYYKLFSQPQKVISERSTIVKEPIIIRHAPKDTIEAARMAYMPDTLEREPAFMSFLFDRNVKLIIEQSERAGFNEKRTRMMFFCAVFLVDFKNNIRQLIHFRLPHYTPVITIALEGDDVRTIYRALPSEVLMGFNY